MKEYINYYLSKPISDRDKLDFLIELSYRQQGYSTRLADTYIQDLFTQGEITVQDHYPNRSASKELLSKILDRLQFEHRMTNKDLQVNHNKCTIKWKHFNQKVEERKYLQDCINELKEKLTDRKQIKDIPEELTKNPFLPEDILPGIGGTSFQVELNKEWFAEPEGIKEVLIVSKPKSPMYQRFLSWITFGLYKPTSFIYTVKEVK